MFQMARRFAEFERDDCRAGQGWPLAGAEPGKAASARERRGSRAHPGRVGDWQGYSQDDEGLGVGVGRIHRLKREMDAAAA